MACLRQEDPDATAGEDSNTGDDAAQGQGSDTGALVLSKSNSLETLLCDEDIFSGF